MDPPVSDVTFFGSKEVSWIPLSVTVSNTWAIKDTVTSYLTKYTLCNGDVGGGDDDHVGNDDVDDVIADHIDG